jgi:hypothetical protein
MYNPLDTIRRFVSRIGKPIRPIIELQKGGSIVNIITSSVQTENVISDTYHTEAWEVMPDSKASAVYIDGIFKGMGFFAGEEGVVIPIKKETELYTYKSDPSGVPVIDKNGNLVLIRVTAAYKGIIGRLLDASLYERGSALKPSMMQTLIYCGLTGLVFFMFGMSYAS